MTAAPCGPGVEYTHFVGVDGDRRLVTTTTTAAGERREERVELGATLDVDLDGSYSTEHEDGLRLPQLLGAADGDHLVIEHSLATSDFLLPAAEQIMATPKRAEAAT